MNGYILVWVICGVIASKIGYDRGASFITWFLAGLLFGPLGVICACFARPSGTCPECRSPIHPEARKCPKCQTAIVWLPKAEAIAAGTVPQTKGVAHWIVGIVLVCLLVLAIVATKP